LSDAICEPLMRCFLSGLRSGAGRIATLGRGRGVRSHDDESDESDSDDDKGGESWFAGGERR